ncbi:MULTISPECIES: molecular chaperone DnaJ [unclassified Pseudomonas]|uniref:molecular chaperone DnaJ n=1 Tax=unclassified Pseudomonas TaxID=196821 RepID=UPI00244C0A66|nr:MULTISPECIES: molecular chaperone DnaJ [unclassified Pseudomonas]MDH0301180.1 molecular chaperone DnaJ [Pseudomonas sp. GD04091]MDH1988350.1 molecular chaperone DnaJ [Pseudomonas sp. GD03689]
MSCWIRLGIEPTQDLDAIRLAYRGQLPAHHPENDPEGFQALRAAYEEALRLAREDAVQAEPSAADDTPHPALKSFHALLEDPALRFDPQAWQRYIDELDELPLDDLDDLGWQLLHTLRDCGPLSHHCAGLLARRLGWAEQLLRLENAHEVEAFLRRLEEPDPFDTALMRDWPATAQMESLWYWRSLEYCYQQRPLFEYEQFASVHTCLAIPDDEALMQRLLVQFSQAGIPSQTFHAQLQARQRQAPDDADTLYLLACQADALGAEQQALDCWLRLYREHQHPLAERWLIDLCARHQAQRLPLLIQAFDRLHAPSSWPADLADPAQAWGSPGQTPQTLARWSEAARLELEGIAGTFVDWRLDGDDELPLLAWLLQDQQDRDLHHLYWQAWALQRGEAGLLRLILARQPGEDALDALILEGFQRQAAQQLQWLEQAPVAQALAQFCASDDPAAMLPEALNEDDIRPVCREWLRRMRVYSAQALHELNCQFDMRRLFTVPFALHLQDRLAEDEILLPPMPQGDALWTWHRQQLFMLALVDQPSRWLALIDPALPGQLHYPPEHPFAKLHALLLQTQASPDGNGGLLGGLDTRDPLQALVSGRLLTLQQAVNSARLPDAAQLVACLDNDDGSLLSDYPLGYLLFCAVLYHDRSLNDEQRTRLRNRLEALDMHGAWFEPLRRGLVAGKVGHPPADAVRAQGIDSRPFNDVIDALDSLLNACTPPKTRTLRALQKIKDDPQQDPGLRCAIMAVLSWTERMLRNDLKEKPAPMWAFWRLNSRLNRTGFALHLLAIALCGSLVLKVPALMAVMGVLSISGFLRRLRDLGHGVPALLLVLVISRVLPVMPLILLGLPGDKLPNRYGPAPGKAEPLEGGLQATLRRLNGQ